jgi:hypothetical protein
VLAERFLELRDERHLATPYNPQMVEYERRREWLEGLAKYAELSLAYAAASTQGYKPLPAITDDADFKGYARQAIFYNQQFSEVARMSGREGETRFYQRICPGCSAGYLMSTGKSGPFREFEDLLRLIYGE